MEEHRVNIRVFAPVAVLLATLIALTVRKKIMGDLAPIEEFQFTENYLWVLPFYIPMWLVVPFNIVSAGFLAYFVTKSDFWKKPQDIDAGLLLGMVGGAIVFVVALIGVFFNLSLPFAGTVAAVFCLWAGFSSYVVFYEDGIRSKHLGMFFGALSGLIFFGGLLAGIFVLFEIALIICVGAVMGFVGGLLFALVLDSASSMIRS